MAHAKAHIGGEIRRRVKDFLPADPGGGRPHHIAHGVAAGFPGGQPHFAQQPQHFGGLFQRNMMQLDVLAGSDMPLLQRSVAFRNVAETVQHSGGHNAAGQLDADHLHFGLTLPVHPLPQPERRECRIVQRAGAEAVNLGVKAPDFILHKGNDCGRVRGQLQAGPVDFIRAGIWRRRGYGRGQGVLLRARA